MNTARPETKRGSHIYSAEPQGFREWRFWTALRMQLCKAKKRAKAASEEKDQDRSRSDEGGPEHGRRERLRRGRMGDRRVQPGGDGGHDLDEEEEEAGENFPFSFQLSKIHAPQSVKNSKSPKKSKDDDEKTDLSSYVDIVEKLMEGLCGDVFLIAREIGYEALLQPMAWT